MGAARLVYLDPNSLAVRNTIALSGIAMRVSPLADGSVAVPYTSGGMLLAGANGEFPGHPIENATIVSSGPSELPDGRLVVGAGGGRIILVDRQLWRESQE